MNRKYAVVAGLAILILAGLAFASTIEDTSEEENSGCPFGKHMGFKGRGFFPQNIKENLGLPEDSTREEIRDAFRERMEERMASIKEELGLPEDATQEQIREALQEKRLAEIKEKLGLPEDATEEEVREALQEWHEENRVLIRGMHRGEFRHRRHGFEFFGR